VFSVPSVRDLPFKENATPEISPEPRRRPPSPRAGYAAAIANSVRSVGTVSGRAGGMISEM